MVSSKNMCPEYVRNSYTSIRKRQPTRKIVSRVEQSLLKQNPNGQEAYKKVFKLISDYGNRT